MQELEKVAIALKKKGFEAEVFESRDQVIQRIKDLVRGCTVGFGGSMTAASLDLVNNILNIASDVYTHKVGEYGDNERKALFADFYFTSANALSMDGHIVNIDGTGNRVAATCFGPNTVVYFIGKNKITSTLEKAIARAKDTAVSIAKLYDRNTPCVKTGKCEDCQSPGCVCSITTIHRKKPTGISVKIFLINEDLGL